MKMPAWFHPVAAALLVAPAFASPVRTQTLVSPDAVPEGLSAPEWSSIRQQYEQHRHAAVPVDGGYQARNPGQQWKTRFDGRGFTTQPDGAAWRWGLELNSYGFAGQERTVAGQPRVTTAGQRVTYDWDATLQEWFVNDQRGLEHGFTVRERPTEETEHPTTNNQHPTSKELAAAALGVGCWMLDVRCFPNPDPLTFTLAVRGGLRPEVQADGRGVRFVDAQGAAALTYSELTVLDADGRKLPARFEPVKAERGVYAASTSENEGTVKRSEDRAPQTDTALLRLMIDERGARYPLTIDPIAQQAYLKASNTDESDAFGISVAVAGDTVVVGVWGDDSNATGVDGDQSDNTAGGSGAAYVFVRSGTTWSRQAYLKASNPGADDWFGYSATVSGDTVVIGAWFEDSNATGVNGNQSNNSPGHSGAAYVFTGLGIGPRLAVVRDGSGGYFLRFTGAPDITYRLQRAPSVTGPWSALVTNTAPASGFIEYHETSPPPGAAFYRTAQP